MSLLRRSDLPPKAVAGLVLKVGVEALGRGLG